jgi:hypothetical protein
VAIAEELFRNESFQLKDGTSLIDAISSLSSSDVGKLGDEDVLRYVAKYSLNGSSRKKAVSELVRMGKPEILEYLALTSPFESTRKSAINGLSKLQNLESLKSLVLSGDEKILQDTCSGLFKNLSAIVKARDAESLHLIAKFSKNSRQKRAASLWVRKIQVVKMIKKMES